MVLVSKSFVLDRPAFTVGFDVVYPSEARGCDYW